MGEGHLDGNCAVAGSFETRRSTHSLLFVLAHDARPHDEFHHFLKLGQVMVARDRVQIDMIKSERLVDRSKEVLDRVD